MLKILLDAVVLSGIISTLRGEDTPDKFTLIGVALGLALVNGACVFFLAPVIGLFFLAPLVLIDGVILMFFCSLTIKQALITLGVLLAYNIVWLVTWNALVR
jgi:hypothetical protein